jgi:hypothetical protein
MAGGRGAAPEVTRARPCSGDDEAADTEDRTMLRIVSITALILAATPALAQNSQSASPSNPTAPVAPPNAPAPPPERIVPPDTTLSDRLSRQQGAITPPNVDPGMNVKPPPNSGEATPVIPPKTGSAVPK